MTSQRETFPHGEDLDYIQRWLRGKPCSSVYTGATNPFIHSSSTRLVYRGHCVAMLEPDGILRGMLGNDSSGITGARIVMTICGELGIADDGARYIIGGASPFTIRGIPVENNIPFEIAGPLTMYAYRAKHKPLQ